MYLPYRPQFIPIGQKIPITNFVNSGVSQGTFQGILFLIYTSNDLPFNINDYDLIIKSDDTNTEWN